MLNFLTDQMLPVASNDGLNPTCSLPDLFQRYGEGSITAHRFLRPHQRHPWHAVCVQLAALALERAGEHEVEHEAATWRALLRDLTADWPEDEPWQLVVDDLAKPAFMQPPVPEGTLAGFKTEAAADDLDVLVTSKNHGVKQATAGRSSPAEWLAALVSLQTTGGFLGAGNYGIARMNGGFATRPGIGLAPQGGPGARWRRDVTLLLGHRDWFFQRLPEFGRRGSEALLWCLPWDGTASLGIDQLDPWFIEVCRRVRLEATADGRITARTRPTKAPRITAQAFKGNLADPWIPVDLEKGSTAYNRTPTYAVMSEVLFSGKWQRPLLLDWHDGDRAPMFARFDVFVRGQGKTDGYLERSVRFDESRGKLFRHKRDQLAVLAENMVKDVRALLGGKVLRTALLALVQGGPAEVKFGDRTGGEWAKKLIDDADREVDRVFFDHLFDQAENPGDEKQLAWLRFLEGLAQATFEQAVGSAPIAAARRPRAIAVAERILRGSLYRTFPDLRPTRHDTRKEPADVA